jgi:hypothetical protein
MYFNYILSSKNISSAKVVFEIDISLNKLWTAFIPIYYIIGLVPFSHQHHNSDTFETFDAIYSQFSPSCSFIPAFGNTFNEKLRFSMRQIKQRGEGNDETRNSSLRL